MASFGSLPGQVASARLWCWNGTQLSYEKAHPLMTVLSELHTNALRHTASGRRCGRVRVEMEQHRDLFWVAVTDDGTPAGMVPMVPRLDGREGLSGRGFGLRLVDGLSVSWGWFGHPGDPITVWAVVDPRTDTLVRRDPSALRGRPVPVPRGGM